MRSCASMAMHYAPAGHVFGPFDGVHADIGAAIDGDDAVAVVAAAQIEQHKQQRDFVRIVSGILEQLEADAEAGVVRPPIFGRSD